ncbi:hypothetical protein ACLKA7_009536 [Drosophila subpalustris]
MPKKQKRMKKGAKVGSLTEKNANANDPKTLLSLEMDDTFMTNASSSRLLQQHVAQIADHRVPPVAVATDVGSQKAIRAAILRAFEQLGRKKQVRQQGGIEAAKQLPPPPCGSGTLSSS